MFFAAKEAFERKHRRLIKEAREEGCRQGREEARRQAREEGIKREREFIRQELLIRGIEITPEIARILEGEPEQRS